MPEYKNCRLEFLHQVMGKKKKHLLRTKLCNKIVPNYPELSVKRCYHNVLQCCPDISDYLPDLTSGAENKLPERYFFWTVVYTLYHDETVAFIERTEQERRNKQLPFNKKINMVVDEDYLNELLKYDFTSK